MYETNRHKQEKGKRSRLRGIRREKKIFSEQFICPKMTQWTLYFLRSQFNVIRESERKLAAIKEIAVKKPEKIQQASTLLETMPPRYLLSATTNWARKPQFGSEANLVGSAFPLKEWDHNETKYKVFFFLSSAVITLLYENERPTQFCIVNYEARVRISSRPNFFKTSFLQLLNCNSPARIIFFFLLSVLHWVS